MEARTIVPEEEFSIKKDKSLNIDLKNIKAEEELSEKEKKIINKVLLKYNFQIKKIIKVKSTYKLETDSGNICLKRIKHGKYKLKNSTLLIQQLNKNNFFNIPKYFNSINGDLYVKCKDYIFYATQWIDGEKCNLNDMEEAVNYVKLLAQYHLATNNIDIRKFKVRKNLKDWLKVFNISLKELEKFERMIVKRKIKNEFDTTYYNNIESFYHRGMIAINSLNTSNYYKLLKLANENKNICYDGFIYKNIIKKDCTYYIMDLYNIIVDTHINDLGKLIKKLMFKNSYQWNFEKAKHLIEAYNSVNKLSKSEIEVMLSLIIFPYKFWKLGKKRYLKHKDWDESKYMRKLEKLIKYDNLQNKFLDDYLTYIENYH